MPTCEKLVDICSCCYGCHRILVSFKSISHFWFIKKSNHFILKCSHQYIWMAYDSKDIVMNTYLWKLVLRLSILNLMLLYQFIHQNELKNGLLHSLLLNIRYECKLKLEFIHHLLEVVCYLHMNMISLKSLSHYFPDFVANKPWWKFQKKL